MPPIYKYPEIYHLCKYSVSHFVPPIELLYYLFMLKLSFFFEMNIHTHSRHIHARLMKCHLTFSSIKYFKSQ
jgi:hypothetical protein